MSRGDEVGVGPKSAHIFAEVHPVEEEVAIPDYVMLDFVEDIALPDKKRGIEPATEPYALPELLG